MKMVKPSSGVLWRCPCGFQHGNPAGMASRAIVEQTLQGNNSSQIAVAVDILKGHDVQVHC